MDKTIYAAIAHVFSNARCGDYSNLIRHAETNRSNSNPTPSYAPIFYSSSVDEVS